MVSVEVAKLRTGTATNMEKCSTRSSLEIGLKSMAIGVFDMLQSQLIFA